MSEPVTIKVLDREYTIGVDPNERDSLIAAAQMLDSRMRDARGNNKTANIDRIAVLVALNLAHELQQQKSGGQTASKEVSTSIGSIHRKLDELFDSLSQR
jgi:cell division protein ZapA